MQEAFSRSPPLYAKPKNAAPVAATSAPTPPQPPVSNEPQPSASPLRSPPPPSLPPGYQHPLLAPSVGLDGRPILPAKPSGGSSVLTPHVAPAPSPALPVRRRSNLLHPVELMEATSQCFAVLNTFCESTSASFTRTGSDSTRSDRSPAATAVGSSLPNAVPTCHCPLCLPIPSDWLSCLSSASAIILRDRSVSAASSQPAMVSAQPSAPHPCPEPTSLAYFDRFSDRVSEYVYTSSNSGLQSTIVGRCIWAVASTTSGSTRISFCRCPNKLP